MSKWVKNKFGEKEEEKQTSAMKTNDNSLPLFAPKRALTTPDLYTYNTRVLNLTRRAKELETSRFTSEDERKQAQKAIKEALEKLTSTINNLRLPATADPKLVEIKTEIDLNLERATEAVTNVTKPIRLQSARKPK